MKRILALAMVSVFAFAGSASAAVTTNDANVYKPITTAPPSWDYHPKDHGQDKYTICHRTSSESNPYVVITVAEGHLEGHQTHPGVDVWPDQKGNCVAPDPGNENPPPTHDTTFKVYCDDNNEVVVDVTTDGQTETLSTGEPCTVTVTVYLPGTTQTINVPGPETTVYVQGPERIVTVYVTKPRLPLRCKRKFNKAHKLVVVCPVKHKVPKKAKAPVYLTPKFTG